MHAPQVFSLPTYGKLAFMIAVTLPIVVLGAGVYHVVTQVRQSPSNDISLPTTLILPHHTLPRILTLTLTLPYR